MLWLRQLWIGLCWVLCWLGDVISVFWIWLLLGWLCGVCLFCQCGYFGVKVCCGLCGVVWCVEVDVVQVCDDIVQFGCVVFEYVFECIVEVVFVLCGCGFVVLLDLVFDLVGDFDLFFVCDVVWLWCYLWFQEGIEVDGCFFYVILF